MTVNTHLVNLASNLVLSSNEKTSITTSINTLQFRLHSYFGNDIIGHFQFGSYSRGTILPRKADINSDIDYMVVFDTSAGLKKPQTYLDQLRRFANMKYSTSEIFQSSPTIVLSLNHIKFELVPSISMNGFQIPSPASSWREWILTDPYAANNAITEKNNSENYKIKPLVRLIKYWNAKQGYPFASFDLEQYIVNEYYWPCYSLKDYFYRFWERFSCSYNTPQYIKDKVDRAKKYAVMSKIFEANSRLELAEKEIIKIVPSL